MGVPRVTDVAVRVDEPRDEDLSPAFTPSNLAASSLDCRRRHLGDLLDAVLVVQEVDDLVVEDLPGELLGWVRMAWPYVAYV